MNKSLPLIFLISIFCISMVSATAWQSYLNNGLVSYYPMNEVSGINVQDMLGINNATTNAVVGLQGYIGNAEWFDGSKATTRIGMLGGIGGTNATSVSMWLKRNATVSTDYFFALGTDITNTRGISVNSSGGMAYLGTATSCQGSSNIPINSWQNVIMTWNATNMTIYLNGTPYCSNIPVDSPISNPPQLYLGAWFNPLYDYFGMIDEVGIWNKTLNQTEITALQTANYLITDGINPNLTIFEPNQTYIGITYIPINFSAVDNVALSVCYFNVTRGASLEIANTYINCSANTTLTVSGDATYLFNMCINDTFNNQNCSSATFKTVSYIPPPSPPSSPTGGGGSFTIFNQSLTNETLAPNLENKLFASLSQPAFIWNGVLITWFTLILIVGSISLLIYEFKNGGKISK